MMLFRYVFFMPAGLLVDQLFETHEQAEALAAHYGAEAVQIPGTVKVKTPGARRQWRLLLSAQMAEMPAA